MPSDSTNIQDIITTAMPAPSKALRSQAVPLRRDKTGLRRTSLHSSFLDAQSPDTPPPTLTSDRRRRASARARDLRSASLSQSSPSFSMNSDMMANGASLAMQHSPGSQSPENLEDAPRTKTGRISTAKKGKPVHRCDDCGKVCCVQSIDCKIDLH